MYREPDVYRRSAERREARDDIPPEASYRITVAGQTRDIRQFVPRRHHRSARGSANRRRRRERQTMEAERSNERRYVRIGVKKSMA